MTWIGGLVITITLMFLTLSHLANLPIVAKQTATLNWNDPVTVYLTGILLSQLIRNVPAIVALLHLAPNPVLLAEAGSVGSSGLVTGSLAKSSTLRQRGGRRIISSQE